MDIKLIELLPELCQRLDLITEYDLCRTTESEMIYLLAQKLNELMVQHNDDMTKVNDKFTQYDDKLRYLLGEGLTEEIGKVLGGMYADGTLQELVGEALIDIRKKIEENKKQIEENKKQIEENKEELKKKDKVNIYLSNCKGVGNAKLNEGLASAVGKKLIIDENITITSTIKAPKGSIIEGAKGVISLSGGRIQLTSNCVADGLILKNLNTSSETLGSTRGIYVNIFDEGLEQENIRIENCYIENCFYNIDVRKDSSTSTAYQAKNIYIMNNTLVAPASDRKCGNIIIQDADNVFITGNRVHGGVNSSAIGVTAGSHKITISNNIVTGNKEASIQIENFPTYGHTQEDANNTNLAVTGNICDGTIWVDDCSNVTVGNNIAAAIAVTVQQHKMKNIAVTGNTVGFIKTGGIYTGEVGALIENLLINGNVIDGREGYWDQKPLIKTVLLSVGTLIKSAAITSNTIKIPIAADYNYGIEITPSLENFDISCYGNNDKKTRIAYMGVVSTDGKLNLYGDTMCNLPAYTTIERDELWNPQIGSVIYNKTTKELEIYKDGTKKWKKIISEV